MISGLVKAGSGTIFARLESLIFARCFFDGLWIRIQWSCDFVGRCPNLRFLIVDFDKISDNFKVIKAAVHNCSELSELYMGDGQRLHLERESIEGITQEFKEYNKYLKANFKVFISKYGVTADSINACDPYADITWEKGILSIRCTQGTNIWTRRGL